MITPDDLLRDNIRDLQPYSSARDEYSGEDAIFLDANENPFGSVANRYPDPQQLKLKVKIGQIKNIHYENIFLGNGSDEAIDLLIRAFCEPGRNNIVAMKPTYGMYKVCADINRVEYREVLLDEHYQLNKEALLECVDPDTRLMFLCSPNNPTSNNLYQEDILYLLENFEGILVLDEAYIDFTDQPSFVAQLRNFPKLVVLQTLSKAWGMAGIRLGMAFASREIIRVLSKIKYPYNVNILTQEYALKMLAHEEEKVKAVRDILQERERLLLELDKLDLVEQIMPSQANFLMVRFAKPREVFHYLMNKKIIVRDRSKVPLCEGYLRLTVGSAGENTLLLKALQEFKYC
ncbi:MAG: histidinol-phosphate transaminase [Bacteroidales bacterium]|nr:histidinol-phosphate transaminase [Bacteroidales bacterium]